MTVFRKSASLCGAKLVVDVFSRCFNVIGPFNKTIAILFSQLMLVNLLPSSSTVITLKTKYEI